MTMKLIDHKERCVTLKQSKDAVTDTCPARAPHIPKGPYYTTRPVQTVLEVENQKISCNAYG